MSEQERNTLFELMGEQRPFVGLWRLLSQSAEESFTGAAVPFGY